MTRHDKEKLLAEIFDGDGVVLLREATLAAGLRALRWRRRRRAAGYAALFILPWALLWHAPRQTRTLAFALPTAVAAPGIERISKEELFALLPHNEIALVGKPGHQQLVFLDQPAPPVVP